MTQADNKKLKPTRCPLCGNDNACNNAYNSNSTCNNDKFYQSGCWCQDSSLTFPKDLIERLPKAEQGAACICINCVTSHLDGLSSQA
ncbi:cysteine-rich CWC family protein [Agaribacterium haliotis]|uniref:cysteine-rich CWC family protein n=1 Tax=Agaribacterium haliotis TaxID=2013869 RepID=UPI000BB54628|nr:cysteine-rich CWC family protein [Agaribacterium haliotis]